ncbi:MAG: hypothetical protein M3O61_16435, partial [Gemmatimonadota bacterium]|nr:hypothetical protein [Gemmatimonadota bacterium]
MNQLMAHVVETDSRFASLYRPAHVTQPIPFFGPISDAAVVTVGVNPSAGEFDRDRLWPVEAMRGTDLAKRLTEYFRSKRHHPWFEGWMGGLAKAGVDSTSGYAHLDLSSRATFSFGKFTRGASADAQSKKLFLEMVECDLPHFSNFLDLCDS